MHEHSGKTSEKFLSKEVVLKELNILPCQTVIDCGCGNGYMAKEFSYLVKENGHVYAVDTDKKAIDRLKDETKGTNMEVFSGDVTGKMPIEDSSADLIYLSLVFHGFTKEQRESFKKEVKRILKQGGKLAVIEIDKKETPYGPPMNIRLSPEELRNTINLKPLSITEVGLSLYLQIFEKIEE